MSQAYTQAAEGTLFGKRRAARSDAPPLDLPALGCHAKLMRYLNLCLLVLFPIAWFAPLMRAALLPIFGMDEISVMTGLQSLWASDLPLALAVTFLAVFAPYAKTIGLALLHWKLLDPRALPVLQALGKLAMADIFLIALYIVIAKGAGYVTIEVAWGLYLFTGCVLASILISWRAEHG